MNSVVYVNSKIKEAYDEDGFISRIKDRFRITFKGESFIKDLKLSVSKVKLPPNFNRSAYMKNMELAGRFAKEKNICLAPKTFRKLDYELLNSHQRRLFGYSVVKSIQLMLRIKNKSIRNSCIVIYNAEDYMNKEVIFELSKLCRYFILLSKDLKEACKLRDYVIANYGVSPVVTNDFKFAVEKADFIVTPDFFPLNLTSPIWCMDNKVTGVDTSRGYINDVTFKTPWEENIQDMSIELLGAIMSIMDSKCDDMDETLRHNGICIDKIMLSNNKVYLDR